MIWISEGISWVNGLDGFLADMVTSAVSVFLGVWLSIRFALKKYVTEKWWEHRAGAYEAVITATYHAFRNVDEVLHAESEGHAIPEDLERELEQMSKRAQEEIAEAKVIGSLKLSSEFLDRLCQLDRELAEAGTIPGETFSWNVHLAETHDAYRKCLDDLKTIARKDLKLM